MKRKKKRRLSDPEAWAKRNAWFGKDSDLTSSKAMINRVINAWLSGDINNLKLPYGRSINYNSKSKKHELRKVDGTVIADFKTPDNEILMQILTAHGAQEKDLAGIDFTKSIFETKKGPFGGGYVKGDTTMQANFGGNTNTGDKPKPE